MTLKTQITQLLYLTSLGLHCTLSCFLCFFLFSCEFNKCCINILLVTADVKYVRIFVCMKAVCNSHSGHRYSDFSCFTLLLHPDQRSGYYSETLASCWNLIKYTAEFQYSVSLGDSLFFVKFSWATFAIQL